MGELSGAQPDVSARGAVSAPVTGDEVLSDAVARLSAADIAVTELSLHLPSLDEVFFTLTGRTAEPPGGNRMTAIAVREGRDQATITPKSRPLRMIRHSLVLAKRNLIGVTRNPEAFLDVTLQPMIFLAMFTYIFGGAIAHGSQHDYLQFLLPGVLAQMVAFGGAAIGVNLNTDIEKGVFDRFRSLPIARAAPLVGAVLGDIVRYSVLCIVTLGFGYILGFRAQTSAPEVLAACLIVVAFALCLSWISVFVGMLARTPGAVQGIVLLIMFPLTFGTSIFVPGHDAARLAAVLHRHQPDHPPGGHDARADARRPGAERPAVDVRLDGDPAGRLRPAGPTGLRAPHVTRPPRGAPARPHATEPARARTPRSGLRRAGGRRRGW